MENDTNRNLRSNHLRSSFLATGLMAMTIACVGCGSNENRISVPQADTDDAETPRQHDPRMLVQTDNDLSDALFGESENSRKNIDSNQPPSLPQPPAVSEVPSVPDSTLSLRANLAPERLTEFLQLSDLEMRRVANRVNAGQMSQAAGDKEMVRIGKLKLQAASQLESTEGSSDRQKVMGVRGQLQSLSHLAALGDLKSAEDLEALAKTNVNHEDVTVAEDSRLVLIGLALERIQNGTNKDASEVLTQTQQLGADGRTPNIAAMMVLGQARVVLEKYGFKKESATVRNQIVDLFASHPDPNVASMALQVTGTPHFAEVDGLFRTLERGDALPLETWRTAVNALLAESPDLAAVQFLAGAALQAEAVGRDDLVDATYEALRATSSLEEREQQEVKIAIDAYKARQSVIGQPVDLDLPSTDGRPLSLSSYQGRIVLIPFWAVGYPESLSLLQLLGEIRDQSEGKVEIVGVNLDSEDAPVDEFLLQSPVPFRSLRSVAKPGLGVTNEAASRFGLVSMPFVVIVGPDGNVAAIDFTGQGLKQTVGELLAGKKSP